MVNSNAYICALEQKLTHKETTKNHKHQKVLASIDWKVVEKIEKKLVKHGRLDKRVVKKLFDERWSTKHCVKKECTPYYN
jgi:hypothetical protein